MIGDESTTFYGSNDGFVKADPNCIDSSADFIYSLEQDEKFDDFDPEEMVDIVSEDAPAI